MPTGQFDWVNSTIKTFLDDSGVGQIDNKKNNKEVGIHIHA